MEQQGIEYTSTSIVDEAWVCKDLFSIIRDRCVQLPKESDFHLQGLHLFDRFCIWLDNTRALSPPRLSFDCRLVERPDFVRRVCEILVMLERNLHVVLEIAYAEKNGVVAPENEAEADDDDYDFMPGFPAVERSLDHLESVWLSIQLAQVPDRREKLKPSYDETHLACYIDYTRDEFPNASKSLVYHIGQSLYARGKELRYLRRFNNPVGEIRLRLQNPAATATGSHVPCSICYKELPVEYLTEEEWSYHVDHDLMPYVCLSEECANPFRFFASFEEWDAHMRNMHFGEAWYTTIHRDVWVCDMDHGPDAVGQVLPVFHVEEDYQDHLKDVHRVYGHDITLAVLENRQENMRDPSACLICGEAFSFGLADSFDETVLKASLHIAEHLASVAFGSFVYLTSAQHAKHDYKAMRMVEDQERRLKELREQLADEAAQNNIIAANTANPEANKTAEVKFGSKRDHDIAFTETLPNFVADSARIEREVINNSPQGKTSYLLSHSLAHGPDGPIQIGNILTDVAHPEVAMAVIPEDNPLMTVTASASDGWRLDMQKISDEQEPLIQALIEIAGPQGAFPAVQATPMGTYHMTKLDTILLQRKPTSAQMVEYMQSLMPDNEEIKPVFFFNDKGIKYGTLYMISGIKIARNFQEVFPHANPFEPPVWTDAKDVVVAYEVIQLRVEQGFKKLHFRVSEFPDPKRYDRQIYLVPLLKTIFLPPETPESAPREVTVTRFRKQPYIAPPVPFSRVAGQVL